MSVNILLQGRNYLHYLQYRIPTFIAKKCAKIHITALSSGHFCAGSPPRVESPDGMLASTPRALEDGSE